MKALNTLVVGRRSALVFGSPILVAVAALLLAGTLTRGATNDLTSLLILVVLAMGWNLVGGYGGQFSLGHSIFVGVGGYATAVFLTYYDLPLPVVIGGAGLLSAAVGVLLAYPLLRLRGPYLAVGSLGLALAALGWMLNWDFTRASQTYPIPGSRMVDLTTVFQITVIVALIAVLSIFALVRSPLGLRLVALRDDEAGAASLGVRRLRTLIPVWALSGFLTGLMGALYALQKGNLTPSSAFSIQFTLDAVIVCVIGGLGTLSGPIIGAVVVFYLRQFTADFADWSVLMEAIVVVLVVRFAPGGLLGVASRALLHNRSLPRRPREREDREPKEVQNV